MRPNGRVAWDSLAARSFAWDCIASREALHAHSSEKGRKEIRTADAQCRCGGVGAQPDGYREMTELVAFYKENANTAQRISRARLLGLRRRQRAVCVGRLPRPGAPGALWPARLAGRVRPAHLPTVSLGGRCGPLAHACHRHTCGCASWARHAFQSTARPCMSASGNLLSSFHGYVNCVACIEP